MKRLLDFSAAYPWPVILIILLLTAMAATTLDNLKIQVSATSLSVEDDPAWLTQLQNIERFGDNDITVIYVEDQELFTPERLSRLRSLTEDLAQIPGVSTVTSLFNTSNIRLDDDVIKTTPFLQDLPSEAQELEEILQHAVRNPLVVNNLISADARHMAINLQLDAGDIDDFDSTVSEAIEALLQQYRGDFSELRQIGPSYIRSIITERIGLDQRSIMPWSVAVLVLALAIAMRSLSGALIPLLTSVVSIVFTLAGMVLLDIPVGVMTSIVPALLIIIGSTEDIHIIAEYKSLRPRFNDATATLNEVSHSIAVAILLTFITTYFGFISIYTNDISLLKEFGLVASSGLVINFLVTSLMVPAILKLFVANSRSRQVGDSVYTRVALWIYSGVQRHQRSVLLVLLVIVVWAVAGAAVVKVNNNPMAYFKQDTPILQTADLLHENLAGVETFTVMLETGIEGTFRKSRYLQEVERLQQHINSLDGIDKTMSFANFMGLLHTIMDQGDFDTVDDLYLPEEDYQIEEYLQQAKHQLFSSFVTEDYSKTRILVRHGINGSAQLQTLIKDLQVYIDEHVDPALKVSITGAAIVRANGADYMAAGQAESLILMSAVIIGILSLLFVTWKAGLVALLPNLFPIVVLFGVMGHWQIPLDTGTAMVAVIALGICVDDTVHFMSRYHHLSRNNDDPDRALQETVREESLPIFSTSLALMLGFVTFAFSSFIPIVYFGLLSAMVMLLALMTTFVITPLLLSRIKLISVWDMLSLSHQAKVIGDCPLFKDMTTWQIKQTILISEVRDYPADAMVIHQGTVGEDMFVILEGRSEVKVTQENGSSFTVNYLEPGSAFGEIALVSSIARTASVITETPSRMLVLKWNSIGRLGRLHKSIALKLYKNLAAIVGNRLTRIDNLTVLHDETSGFMNRNLIEQLTTLEIYKAARYHEPLSVVFFSVFISNQEDLFNKVLKELSARVRADTRNIDAFGRWDEQRFYVLLPRTTTQELEVVRQRLESHFEPIMRHYGLANDYVLNYWTSDTGQTAEQLKADFDRCLQAQQR